MMMLNKSSLLVAFVASVGVLASAQGPRRVALGDWPEARGPNRDGISQETGLDREVGAERRELPLARAVRRPLGADRHGQPRLPAEPVRPRRRPAGARHGPRRRHRQGRLGIQVQRLSERRAAAPRRLGLAGRRSRNRQHLRARRRRERRRPQQGRQAALGALDRRGVRRLHHARRPDDVAAHRRRSGDRERGDLELGRAGQPRAPLPRARQAHRRHRLGRAPGRPSVRHGVRRADHRDDQRPAAAHRRHRRRRHPRDQAADRREGLELRRRQARHQHRRRRQRARASSSRTATRTSTRASSA